MIVFISDTDRAYAENLAEKLEKQKANLTVWIDPAEAESRPGSIDLILVGNRSDVCKQYPEIPRLHLERTLAEPMLGVAEGNPFYLEDLCRYTLPERLIETLQRWEKNHRPLATASRKLLAVYLTAPLPADPGFAKSPFHPRALVLPLLPPYLLPGEEEGGKSLSDWIETRAYPTPLTLQEIAVRHEQRLFLRPFRHSKDFQLAVEGYLEELFAGFCEYRAYAEPERPAIVLCGGLPPAAFHSIWQAATAIHCFCPLQDRGEELKAEIQQASVADGVSVHLFNHWEEASCADE